MRIWRAKTHYVPWALIKAGSVHGLPYLNATVTNVLYNEVSFYIIRISQFLTACTCTSYEWFER